MPNTLRQRLRIDNVHGALGANYTIGSGVMNLGAALSGPATPNGTTSYLPVIVNPNTTNENVVYVTGPAVSGTLYPVLAGQEGSTDHTGSTSDPWQHGPTVNDFAGVRRTLGPYPIAYTDANLATGIPLFTPRAGDVLHNMFIVVHTLFVATTPTGNDTYVDVGTFLDSGDSWFTLTGSSGSTGVLWAGNSTDTGIDLSGTTASPYDTSIEANLESNGTGRAALIVLNSVPICVRITGALTTGNLDLYAEVSTPVTAYA